jgi:glycosyltransferase involved in cell wall biosynthesis
MTETGTRRISKASRSTTRVGFLASHPIQYQAPLFRRLAQEPGYQFEALFCTSHGVKPSFDSGFDRTIHYDVPLLEGYRHRFLTNWSPRPGPGGLGQLNPRPILDILRKQFDALIVHGYSSVTNLLALLAPRPARTRLLLRGESHLREPRSLGRLAIKRAVLPALFQRVDQFLAIGSLNRDYYLAYGVPAERITLAPYTVDSDYFATRVAALRRGREQIRYELGLPRGVPILLFCGKLISVKRPLDVVRAFARVRAQMFCGLAIAGTGPLEREVKAEAERLGVARDVAMVGFRNQSELPSIYAVSDVLILPSGREPWGLVVNEAMAAGLAIAVSDCVGAGPDLVTDNGLVFPAGDTETLARGLLRLITEPGLLARSQGASLARIAEWGLDQTVDGIRIGIQAAMER